MGARNLALEEWDFNDACGAAKRATDHRHRKQHNLSILQGGASVTILLESHRNLGGASDLSRRRLSGLARDSGDLWYSGSSNNLHDLAGARISVLTEKHGGGGSSCLSGPIPMSRTAHKLGLLPVPTFTIPHEQGEAEEKQTPFPNQVSNSYSTPWKPNNVPKPKDVPKPISNIRSNCHKPNQISEPNNYSHVNSKSNFQQKPTLPKNQTTTLSDMMKFASAWFEFEENKNFFCDILEDRFITCGKNDQEDLVKHFNVVKFENMADQICPTAQSGPTTSVAEVNVPIGEQLEKMTK